MIQVFRLVDPGRVDRVIGFDELPNSLTTGVTRGSAVGLPRAWQDYLGVKRGDVRALPFYVLDFRTLNRDKERWQEISNYVRRSTHKDVRLFDNLYEMAKPMSVDSYSSLELDPEDIIVIPIIKEEVEPVKTPEIVEAVVKEVVKEVVPVVIPKKEENPFEVPLQKGEPVVIKKRGRPKKEVVA